MEETTNPEVNSVAENAEGTKIVDYAELIKTDKTLQSFVDSKISKANETAIKNAREQWMLEQDSQKTEAEKLAQMNEKQKLEYQVQKANQEAEKIRATLNAYQMKDQAVEMASEKGMDATLLNLIDFKTISADALGTRLDEIQKVVNTAVEKAINERLKEKAPINKQTEVKPTTASLPNLF